MKKVGIVGYGRFGKLLSNLLEKKYEVLVTMFYQILLKEPQILLKMQNTQQQEKEVLGWE